MNINKILIYTLNFKIVIFIKIFYKIFDENLYKIDFFNKCDKENIEILNLNY